MGLIEDAGNVWLEEPDWREFFEVQTQRWPRLPRYLQEDSAFEATLQAWRKHHFTWVARNNKAVRSPASAAEAMIALAKLRIFPPRFLHKDVPRTDECGFQCDDHMWLSIRQEQWRITAIEDRMLHLEKGFGDKPETMQIDLGRARWAKYIEAAIAVLEAQGTMP
jgi:hypothetical protein